MTKRIVLFGMMVSIAVLLTACSSKLEKFTPKGIADTIMQEEKEESEEEKGLVSIQKNEITAEFEINSGEMSEETSECEKKLFEIRPSDVNTGNIAYSEFYYNSDGQLTESWAVLLLPDIVTGGSRLEYLNSGTVQYKYDENGNLVSAESSDGIRYEYEYDNDGQCVYEICHDNVMGDETSVTYHYENGILVSSDNTGVFSHGAAHEYQTDSEGHVTYEKGIDGDDYEVWYEYDTRGNLVKKTENSYNGSTETYFTYDEEGYLKSNGFIDCLWGTWEIDGNGESALVIRYPDGELEAVKEFYPDGSMAKCISVYYPNGQLCYKNGYLEDGRPDYSVNEYYDENGNPNWDSVENGTANTPDYWK